MTPDADDIADGITYDNNGRMLFHPEFHTENGKPFTIEELVYLAKFYECDGRRSMAFALGRTEGTIQSKVHELRKENMFDILKNLVDDEWSKLLR